MDKSAYLDVMGISRWQQARTAVLTTSLDAGIKAGVPETPDALNVQSPEVGQSLIAPELLASVTCLFSHPLFAEVTGAVTANQLRLRAVLSTVSSNVRSADASNDTFIPMGALGLADAKKAFWRAICASGVL